MPKAKVKPKPISKSTKSGDKSVPLRAKPPAKSTSKKATKGTPAKVKSKPVVSKLPVITDSRLAMRKALGSQMNSLEKEFRISGASMIPPDSRMSSGLLVVDLIDGGGYTGGMYSIAGREASGKSTLTMVGWAQGLVNGLPLIGEWDAEGSVGPELTGSIFKTYGLDPNLDVHIKGDNPPSRYYVESTLETFFDYMSRLLRRMPTKTWFPHEQIWAYELPKRNERAKMIMEQAMLKPSKALSNEFMNVCPTENIGIEGLVVMDSWPSLILDRTDTDEKKGSKAMALMARAFSEYLPQIKGKLRKKQVTLIGVNQIRLKPGVTHGNPEYEPGGEALKFFSDNRKHINHRATPDGWKRHKENGNCVEPSAIRNGATDEYQFKQVKNTKNKFSTPFHRGWTRIWVSDHKGKGRGFDLVYDCWEYLKMTGQIKGSRNKFTITLECSAKGVQFSWETFKALITGECYGEREVLLEALKTLNLDKKPRIREKCFAQIRSGKAMSLMSDLKAGDTEDVYDGDDEADDIEDDDDSDL